MRRRSAVEGPSKEDWKEGPRCGGNRANLSLPWEPPSRPGIERPRGGHRLFAKTPPASCHKMRTEPKNNEVINGRHDEQNHTDTLAHEFSSCTRAAPVNPASKLRL